MFSVISGYSGRSGGVLSQQKMAAKFRDSGFTFPDGWVPYERRKGDFFYDGGVPFGNRLSENYFGDLKYYLKEYEDSL